MTSKNTSQRYPSVPDATQPRAYPMRTRVPRQTSRPAAIIWTDPLPDRDTPAAVWWQWAAVIGIVLTGIVVAVVLLIAIVGDRPHRPITPTPTPAATLTGGLE